MCVIRWSLRSPLYERSPTTEMRPNTHNFELDGGVDSSGNGNVLGLAVGGEGEDGG